MKPAALAILICCGCLSHHPGPPSGAPRDAKFVTIDGVPVRYLDVGQGPAVVLIHGFASSLDVWRGIVPALAENHRVLALDLKGFGFSGRPAGDYSPVAQARLVRGFLDARGVERTSVVAHSWGAGVALALTIENPERVDRVALLSAYVFDQQVPPFFRWAQHGALGDLLFSLYYRQGVEDRVALAFHDPALATQERVDLVERELAREGTVAAALAAVRGQRYSVLERRYSSIAHQTLLLWGENDLVTPVRYGHRLLRELPNARLVTYQQCGHMPMFEAPGPVRNQLVNFLAPTKTAKAEAAP
jgi:pimeloyl-ACP methyl ester carboxylesterase